MFFLGFIAGFVAAFVVACVMVAKNIDDAVLHLGDGWPDDWEEHNDED